MTKGGSRAGAGAPRGNLNALKHGRTSRQLQRFVATILKDPGQARLLKLLVQRKVILGQEIPREETP